MDRVLENELPRIIKRLCSETFIKKAEKDTGDYNLITNNYNELSGYLKDSFGLELIGANQKYLLRKYSMKDPIGINGKDDKTLYILFALILSELTLRNAGDFILWTTEFESACNKYAEEYCDGKKLTSGEQYMHSKDILKYLMDNGYITEIKKDEEKDNEQFECYKLEIDIDQKLYKKIVLNKFLNNKNEVEQGKIKVLQTLLLNGYISKSENEEEYNLMKNGDIHSAVSDVFQQLLNSDGIGFELIEWGNHYMLSYKGASGFPNPNNKEGMLAIEVLSMLEPGETYTFDEEMEDLGCSNSPYCAENLNKQIMHEWAQLIENQEYYKQEVLKRYFANSNFKEILKDINDNKILCSAQLYKIQEKDNGFPDKIKIGEYRNFQIQDS